MDKVENIKVWDLLVRVFHWSLVAFFSISYLSGDDFEQIHIWSSYAVLFVIFIRLVWGLVGSPYARFSQFVQPPKVIVQYLKDILNNRAKRYVGHNPAGGAMIIVLLIFILLTGLSGLLLYGLEDHAGPFAFLFQTQNESLEELLEESHELLANFTILLVIVHISGVLFESYRHKENIIRAMITGYKKQ